MTEENKTTEEIVAKELVKGETGRIHIKGIGHAAQIPNQVVLSMTLTAQNKEYSAAVKIGSQQIEMLREAVVEAGFEADALKTTNFNVRSVYEDEEYKEGKSTRYRKVFVAFECSHDLKLTFDFDNKKINKAIDTIASCLSQPKISIAFTVKDTEAFSDEILKSAAKDARRKARVLCSASKVKLGKLLNINYSWDETIVREEILVCSKYEPSEKNSFDFRPEEIKASDTVDFLWEIEQ